MKLFKIVEGGKEMKADKKTLMFAAVIAILVAVIGGGIVYASLTQRLDINGSADFVPESWKVHFVSGTLSTPTLGDGLTGLATVSGSPSLSDTAITGIKMILRTPGDSAAYQFDIKNSGTLDAKLTTVSIGSPTCEGTVVLTATADEAAVCNPSHLTYTLKYVSGDIPAGKSAGDTVAINDELDAGQQVKVELKLAFSAAGTNPTNTVEITGLDSYLIYTSQ